MRQTKSKTAGPAVVGDPSPRPGALEGLSRAAAILRVVAASGPGGMRLSDVAGAVRLTKSTTHRLLAALAVERFIKRHARTGLYQLGEDIALLGWSASAQSLNLRDLCRPGIERIAEITGDTAFLASRSGAESVCIDRCFGPYPIKTLTIDVGSRRPLGVGAGALAMMAALSDWEIERVVAMIGPELDAFPGFSRARLPSMIAATRGRGYSFSDGLIAEGVCGLGVCIVDGAGEPLAALSVAGLSRRFRGPRLDAAIALLLEQKCVADAKIRAQDRQQVRTARATRR